MWAVVIVLLLGAAMILMMSWDRRTGLLDPKRFREAPLIPTRKQRFAEYVRGERQLMAEWEEAFGTGPVPPEPDTFDAYVKRVMRRHTHVPRITSDQVWREEKQKAGAMPPSPTPGAPMLNPPMDPYQPVAGHSPSMRFSSAQVCWDQARYMMGRSRYADFQLVVRQCERMDA